MNDNSIQEARKFIDMAHGCLFRAKNIADKHQYNVIEICISLISLVNQTLFKLLITQKDTNE